MADPRADQACEETDWLKQKQVLTENCYLKAWVYMRAWCNAWFKSKEVPDQEY